MPGGRTTCQKHHEVTCSFIQGPHSNSICKFPVFSPTVGNVPCANLSFCFSNLIRRTYTVLQKIKKIQGKYHDDFFLESGNLQPVFSLPGNWFGHFPCFPCAVRTLFICQWQIQRRGQIFCFQQKGPEGRWNFWSVPRPGWSYLWDKRGQDSRGSKPGDHFYCTLTLGEPSTNFKFYLQIPCVFPNRLQIFPVSISEICANSICDTNFRKFEKFTTNIMITFFFLEYGNLQPVFSLTGNLFGKPVRER